MGRLSAVHQLGQLGGTILAGLLAAQLGVDRSFLMFSVAGSISLLASLGLPAGTRSESRASTVPIGVAGLIRMQTLRLSFAYAFLGAQALSLVQSFYPILLSEAGFRAEEIGSLLSVRSIGAIAFGLWLAPFVAGNSRSLWAFAATVVMGGAIGLTPVSDHYLPLFLLLAGLGVTSSLLELQYQVLATESGAAGGVATALAPGGLGWSLSLSTTPLLFGMLVDLVGLTQTFHAWGALLVAIGLVMGVVQRSMAIPPHGNSAESGSPNPLSAQEEIGQ
jgi:hypothetical protein